MSKGRRVALVFDFDGTIIDTETPVYESWRFAYELADVEPIALDIWKAHIGLAGDEQLDVRGELCVTLGVDELPPEIDAARVSRRDEVLHALPLREGVLAWLDEAAAAGLAVAVGSSSPTTWVDGHLRRLGLRDRFAVLSCADPGIPGKPDPTVYREACRLVGADPAASLAIEDSPHGVAAAIGAGMRCLAAPGPMTVGGDFSAATAVAGSLAHLRPADWF